MGTRSQVPTELSREDLEEEVARLRDLEERIEALEALISTFDDIPEQNAGLTEILIAGNPAGKLIDSNNRRIKELESVVNGDGESRRPGGDRNQMLPVHRMYGDLKTGAGHSLGKTQKRAARVFGEFVERVVSNESNKVDTSGQMYTLTSSAVEEVLLGKTDDEFENLLTGVKEASRSQITARTMREVARLSKFAECRCEEIDGCQHTEIRFRSSRPNTLAAPKQSFREAMGKVYNESTD